MYVPNEAESITTGQYLSCGEDSSSPDGANSCSTQQAVASSPSSPPPPREAATTKNVVWERNRRRKLNEKLYALRSVVPNITKMDKATIIRDAIAYIEQLQEQERRMLAEISVLRSSDDTTAGAAVKTEDAATGQATNDGGDDSNPWRKRMRMAASDDGLPLSMDTSPPLQILEVQVSEAAGEKVAVVSLRCSRARDRQQDLPGAGAAGDTIVHTMFVQIEEMGGAQLKPTIEAALVQLDVPRCPLKTTSNWED